VLTAHSADERSCRYPDAYGRHARVEFSRQWGLGAALQQQRDWARQQLLKEAVGKMLQGGKGGVRVRAKARMRQRR
jgi:hypothetical protein